MNTAQGLLAEYSSDELRRILQEREGVCQPKNDTSYYTNKVTDRDDLYEA